jgi:ribosome-binding protein aMBF1 (putative translation factor)
VIAGAQIRLARAILGWQRQKLAKQSGVTLSAIIRAESGEGEPSRPEAVSPEATRCTREGARAVSHSGSGLS